MIVHFRLTVPAAQSDEVRDLLIGYDAATNITLDTGAVLRPEGDLIEADVARERAGELVERLRDLGIHRCGGIVLTTPSGTPFRAARELEAATPGHPDDAVIWESVVSSAEAGAVPTLSYHVFLVIAVALAAVAVIEDSPVLVVGAMVVGPEYSAIAALSAGVALWRPRLMGESLRLVVLSFVFAIAAVTALALVARGVGLLDVEEVTRPRPNTGFIWHPDVWSGIVALFAGAAGALALAIEKSATMVGVFISVTTVPAAGNLALGLAVLNGNEIAGSGAQLLVNLVFMTVSGALLLVVVKTVWPWLAARSEQIFRTEGDI